MIELQQRSGVFAVDLVYCAYGAAWLKPTRLLTNIEELKLLACRCSRSHAHQELRGVSPQGVFWTRLAAVYPQQLCQAYAGRIEEALRAGHLPSQRSRPSIRQPIRPLAVVKDWCRIERWSMAWQSK